MKTLQLKGDLCAYCTNLAEFVSIKNEMPMCAICIESGTDV